MKNIIITGASKGIGFETVKLFLEETEYHVYAISRTIATLQALGHARLTPISFDITSDDFSNIESMLSNISQVDILINNAGLLINKSFMELTNDDWQRMFGVNVFGAARLVQIALPQLKAAEKAHIVNIGSMGGFQGSSKFPGLSAYSASKGAIAILTECLAAELSEFGVRSNCLCLGAVNTEMLGTAFPGYKAPLNSDEMARFLFDFSQNGHQFFNGQTLPVALNNPG